jgi:hypothetical protein
MPDLAVPIDFIPRKVVSLVPSVTESLIELGFGQTLVGITDYCIHPAESVARIARIGGTKAPRVEDIVRLSPDLVIANQEENSEESVAALRSAGVPVWITFPNTVESALEDLSALARLFRSDRAHMMLRSLEQAVEFARLSATDRLVRYFCPIWQGQWQDAPWWMTFNRNTYCADLLELLGGKNIFDGRDRKYPLEAEFGEQPAEPAGLRDTRYPHVSLKEIVLGQPELVLLPDEPYLFSEKDEAYLQKCLADSMERPQRFVRIDGTLITWPGTRIGKAIAELSDLFC